MDSKHRHSPFNLKMRGLFLIILWILVQLFLYWRNGIVTQLESVKYIDQAKALLNTGHFESANFLFYSTEILLITFCLKYKISFLFIVFVQEVVNAFSMILFYRLVLRLSKNKTLAMLTTAALIGFIYYQEFNTFLFTESLFFSFSIIYTYALFSIKKPGVIQLTGVLFLLILLYFTRPTGLFFLPATLFFIFLKKYVSKSVQWKFAAFGVILLVFFILLNFSLGSGGEFNFVLPYIKENVICGVSTVSVPHSFTLPPDQNSIAGIFYIISHYFGLFVKLGVRRLAAFFGIYRSYYSFFHNIAATGLFFITYFIIFRGWKSLFYQYKAESAFLITNIFLMAITVMITCDEWGNRFILGQLPYFMLLAIISYTNFKEKTNEKQI